MSEITKEEIKVGGNYIDAITGRLLTVIDNNNKPPLNKYYCQCEQDNFGCFRKAKDLLSIML